MNLKITLMLIAFLLVCGDQRADSTLTPISRLQVPFIKEPSSLWIGSAPIEARPIEIFRRLILVTGDKRRSVKSLADLSGYANIETPTNALQYVRLRTATSLWSVWHNDRIYEIVDASHAGAMPNFGIKDIWRTGVIADSDFNRLGFSAPLIDHTAKGWSIKRWVIGHNTDRPVVRHILEEVGSNGSYTCQILEARPAPKLSAYVAAWTFPAID